MKKIFVLLSLLSLKCVGMDDTITVPGTDWRLDLSETAWLGTGTFKENSESTGGVDIVAIPRDESTGDYFEGKALRKHVEKRLYTNPRTGAIFDPKEVKMFNVTKVGRRFRVENRNVNSLLPRGLVGERADEIAGALYVNLGGTEFSDVESKAFPAVVMLCKAIAAQTDSPKAQAIADLLLGEIYLSGRMEKTVTGPLAQKHLEAAAGQTYDLGIKAIADYELGINHISGDFAGGGCTNANWSLCCFHLEEAITQNEDLLIKQNAGQTLEMVHMARSRLDPAMLKQ